MKRLGKLSINPEKIIKNEELVNLKGGYNPKCPGTYCEPYYGAYYCECVGSVGSWCVCATSEWAAEQSGSQWCSSGEADCGLYYFT